MADDQIFRLILIAGFAIIMPASMYYRVKSQASRESLDRRQEGLFVLWTLRHLGITAMVGVIADLISPDGRAGWAGRPRPSGGDCRGGWSRCAGHQLRQASGCTVGPGSCAVRSRGHPCAETATILRTSSHCISAWRCASATALAVSPVRAAAIISAKRSSHVCGHCTSTMLPSVVC